MTLNYSSLTDELIPADAFTDSQYVGEFTNGAWYLLLIGTICTALAFFMYVFFPGASRGTQALTIISSQWYFQTYPGVSSVHVGRHYRERDALDWSCYLDSHYQESGVYQWRTHRNKRRLGSSGHQRFYWRCVVPTLGSICMLTSIDLALHDQVSINGYQ